MLLFDIGQVDTPVTPITTIMTQSSSTTKNTNRLYATMGVCAPTVSANGEPRSMAVSWVAASAFSHKKFPLYTQNFPEFSDFAERTAATQVLRQPKFGILSASPGGSGNPYDISYEYTPNQNYKGNDSAEFLVTFDEYKVKVIYFFKVVDEKIFDGPHDHEKVYAKYCKKPFEWLISSTVQSENATVGDIGRPGSGRPGSVLSCADRGQF